MTPGTADHAAPAGQGSLRVQPLVAVVAGVGLGSAAAIAVFWAFGLLGGAFVLGGVSAYFSDETVDTWPCKCAARLLVRLGVVEVPAGLVSPAVEAAFLKAQADSRQARGKYRQAVVRYTRAMHLLCRAAASSPPSAHPLEDASTRYSIHRGYVQHDGHFDPSPFPTYSPDGSLEAAAAGAGGEARAEPGGRPGVTGALAMAPPQRALLAACAQGRVACHLRTVQALRRTRDPQDPSTQAQRHRFSPEEFAAMERDFLERAQADCAFVLCNKALRSDAAAPTLALLRAHRLDARRALQTLDAAAPPHPFQSIPDDAAGPEPKAAGVGRDLGREARHAVGGEPEVGLGRVGTSVGPWEEEADGGDRERGGAEGLILTAETMAAWEECECFNGDACVVCMEEWRELPEDATAVVLPCRHALCSQCLMRWHETIAEPASLPGVPRPAPFAFACPQCKRQVPPGILAQILASYGQIPAPPVFRFSVL